MRPQAPAVSLIVPIYNSEVYLPSLLEDISSQSFGGFECILVNDGSTDGSLELCTKKAERDPRFIVLSGPNEGLSAARNKGLAASRGKLIGFIDSDDRINLSYLEALKKGIDKGADVSVCRYASVLKHSEHFAAKTYSACVEECSFKNYFSSPHIGLIAGNYCWAKLYRREVIDGIFFKECDECGNEDFLFSFEVASRVKKIAYINSALYYYLLRFNSLSASKNKLKKKIPLSIKTLIALTGTLDPDSREFIEIAPYAFQNIACYHLQAMTKGLDRDSEYIDSLVPLIPEMDRLCQVWKEHKNNLRFMHRYFYGTIYKVLSAREKRAAKKGF